MEEVINKLLLDDELVKLTKGQIKPFGQLGITGGLTYEFSLNSSNGIRSVDRLTVTAVGYSIDSSLAIMNRVKKLLLTIGDVPFSPSIKKIVQNGGGSTTNVVDGNVMYHFTAIFYITRREK